MSPVCPRPEWAHRADFSSAARLPCVEFRSVLRLLPGLVLGACLTLQARAQEAVGFERALEFAQARSHQLVAQERAASAARDMAVAAGQRPDPILKLGVNNLPIDGPDRFSPSKDFMTMRSAGVMQEFTRSDKRLARSKRFEQEAQASEAVRAMMLTSLQRATATAWLDCFYQNRILVLLVSQRDEARLQIDAAEAAYRAGKGAQADVFAARERVAKIDERLVQTQGQAAVAQTQLRRWVGDTAFSLAWHQTTPPDVGHLPGHVFDSESIAQRRPEIVLLDRREGMALAEVEAAQANRRADWTAELMFNQRGSAYSNMVSINVSVPWQWDQGQRQDRELAAKLAAADQMRFQREESLREHLAQIQAMHQTWQSGLDRLSRYDGTLLPLASQRTQASLTAYRAGTGTLASLLAARLDAGDAQLERVKLEMEVAQVWAQLAYLIPSGQDPATATATATTEPQ